MSRSQVAYQPATECGRPVRMKKESRDGMPHEGKVQDRRWHRSRSRMCVALQSTGSVSALVSRQKYLSIIEWRYPVESRVPESNATLRDVSSSFWSARPKVNGGDANDASRLARIFEAIGPFDRDSIERMQLRNVSR